MSFALSIRIARLMWAFPRDDERFGAVSLMAEEANLLENQVLVLKSRLLRLELAAGVRIAYGHNDTCGSEVSKGSPCSCGHDLLLKETDAP